MSSDTELSLGAVVRRAMDIKGISSHQLSNMTGISLGSVSNIMRHGEVFKTRSGRPKKEYKSNPNAMFLRKIATVLELDYLRLFKLAGYIPDDYQPYAVDIFGKTDLETEQMRYMQRLLEDVEALRQEHAAFFDYQTGGEVNHINAGFEQAIDTQAALAYIAQTINTYFESHSEWKTVGSAEIEPMLAQPYVQIVLNLLIPTGSIKSPLGKFWWICIKRPQTNQFYTPEEETQAFRDLWRLLHSALSPISI
jgi:transcriptional regulator with XRE-family HTH domain